MLQTRQHRKLSRAGWLVLLGLTGLLFQGCTGYRTYNSLHWAKEAFKEGKKAQENAGKRQFGPSGQMMPQSRPQDTNQPGATVIGQDNFEEAAKKCLYFLSQNTKGRRVDDALMLMGKAFFELHRYIQADNSFQKLLDTQRKSKFRDDAQYYLIQILLQQNQMPQAETSIEHLIDEFPKSEYRPLAQFRLGEKYLDLENYDRASEVFYGVLDNYPKFKFKGETLSNLGKIYFEKDSLDRALSLYERLNKEGRDRAQRREGLLGMARTRSRQGKHDQSLALYQRALAEARYADERAESWVGIYVEYTFMGRSNEARDGFNQIIHDFSRTDYASAAWYELGLLYKGFKESTELDSIPCDSLSLLSFKLNSTQLEPLKKLSQDLLSLKLAEMAFGNVPRESNFSPLVDPAREQEDEVRMLYQIFEQMEASDSTTSRDALARLQFLLAEFHHNSGQIERARTEYERLLFEYPNTIWTPKAALNLAWVSRDLGDSLRCRQALELLVQSFPDTRYADQARIELGLPIPEGRPEGFFLNELAAYAPPKITRAETGPGGAGGEGGAPGHETWLQMRRRVYWKAHGAGGGA